MLKAKIHQAIVTEANLYYVGSITLDSHILKELELYPNEKVTVVNINNGARLDTYVIPGIAHSGVCCLNGAAARHFHPGDKIIVMSYCLVDKKEALLHRPKIAFMQDNNQINKIEYNESENTLYTG